VLNEVKKEYVRNDEMSRTNGQFNQNDYIKRKEEKISRTTEEVNASFISQSLKS
jgi:hypothetical protein